MRPLPIDILRIPWKICGKLRAGRDCAANPGHTRRASARRDGRN